MMHCSGPITSFGEERAFFSAFACGLCNEVFPLPLGAEDGLCYCHIPLAFHIIMLNWSHGQAGLRDHILTK